MIDQPASSVVGFLGAGSGLHGGGNGQDGIRQAVLKAKKPSELQRSRWSSWIRRASHEQTLGAILKGTGTSQYDLAIGIDDDTGVAIDISIHVA